MSAAGKRHPPAYRDFVAQEPSLGPRPSGSARPPMLSVRPPSPRLASLERENRQLMANQGRLVQETNRRLAAQAGELRLLKEENGRLAGENAELRDLCVYLDDERQKTRRLGREWTRFGRYTAGVMKEEVAAYRAKLADLEAAQAKLLAENEEMKQLCLFLDTQRAKEEAQPPQPPPTPHCETPKSAGNRDHQPRDLGFKESPESGVEVGAEDAGKGSTDEVLAYIGALEQRVAQLESTSMSNLSATSSTDDRVTIRLRDPMEASTDSASTVYASSLDEAAEDEGFAPSEESPSPANSTLTPIEEEASEDLEDSSDDDVPFTSPRRFASGSRRRSSDSGRLSSSVPAQLNEVGAAEDDAFWTPLQRTTSLTFPPKQREQQVAWTSVGSQGTSLSEALRVLEVQERTTAAASSATDKAIIHQMCKVVWKTLDDDAPMKDAECLSRTYF